MKRLIPLLVIVIITFNSCGEKKVTTAAWLNDRAWIDAGYTQEHLVKSKLQFPLTAKFKHVDAGIEDTDLHTISVTGHVIADGVASELAFAAVFRADSLGNDSLLSFQMK